VGAKARRRSVSIRFSRGVAIAIALALLGAALLSLSGCMEKTVLVPRVEGMSEAEAKKALDEVGLVAEGDVAAAGGCFVCYTEPPAGNEIKEGSPVQLVMAVEVPNLTGTIEPEAIEILGSMGLEVVVEREYDESVANGAVASLEPGAGTECCLSSPVKLIVSRGSKFITCPVCVGKGWVNEYSNCNDNGFKWCRDNVQVSCKNCSGTGKILREDASL